MFFSPWGHFCCLTLWQSSRDQVSSIPCIFSSALHPRGAAIPHRVPVWGRSFLYSPLLRLWELSLSPLLVPHLSFLWHWIQGAWCRTATCLWGIQDPRAQSSPSLCKAATELSGHFNPSFFLFSNLSLSFSLPLHRPGRHRDLSLFWIHPCLGG